MNWRTVGQTQVQQPRLPVDQQGFQVVSGGIPLCLSILSHDVAHIDLWRVRLGDGFGHPVHQQIGDHTGIQAPRAQQDQIRVTDGLQSGGQRGGPLWDQRHPRDPAVLLFFKMVYLGLSHHTGPVFKDGLQLHVRTGNRDDSARDRQHLAHLADRLLKGAGHPIQGRQNQVAKGLSGEGALSKAVGQQLLHDGLRVGQGLHTVADITRGRHSNIPAKHSRASPVIRHSDDGGQILGIFF